MPSPAVTVVIEYRARPDRQMLALAELDALVATVVAAEADCFGIQLLQDPADPTRLLLIERWSSQAAYQGPHFETPHLKAFIARAAELFAGPPRIEFWVKKSEYPHPAG